MRSLPAKEIVQILLANGFALTRQKRSHQIYRNPANGIIVPVPLHGMNKPIPIGTFLSIVKQSKIPKEQFEK